jgi:hypothetical protein
MIFWTSKNVDRNKIGIIIVVWRFALNAAAKRVKAATSTMYDMTRVMSKATTM